MRPSPPAIDPPAGLSPFIYNLIDGSGVGCGPGSGVGEGVGSGGVGGGTGEGPGVGSSLIGSGLLSSAIFDSCHSCSNQILVPVRTECQAHKPNVLGHA